MYERSVGFTKFSLVHNIIPNGKISISYLKLSFSWDREYISIDSIQFPNMLKVRQFVLLKVGVLKISIPFNMFYIILTTF